MELKYVIETQEQYPKKSSNCTFMELKYEPDLSGTR